MIVTKNRSSLFIPILLGTLLSILLISSFTSVPELFIQIDKKLTIRKIKVAASIVLLVFLYVYLFKIIPKNRILNLVTTIFSIAFLFLVLELTFLFVAKSHGNQQSYSSKIWRSKFWHLNEEGYRDQTQNYLQTGDLETILFLGDSFLAGYGIKKVEDRFSNIVARHFKNEYTVFNTGKNGIQTVYEFHILNNFPIVPNKVFLVHVPNDILDVIPRSKELYGLNKKMPSKPFFDHVSYSSIIPSSEHLFRKLGRQSFFFNFMYWYSIDFFGELKSQKIKTMKEYQNMSAFNETSDYIHWYTVDELYTLHLKYINLIIEFCDRHAIELAVLLFPEISNTLCELSKDYINAPLRLWLEHKNIDVIDLSSKICALPQNKKVVNLMDHHPNEMINEIVANEIISILE